MFELCTLSPVKSIGVSVEWDPELPAACVPLAVLGSEAGEVLTKVGDASLCVFMCHTSELKH